MAGHLTVLGFFHKHIPYEVFTEAFKRREFSALRWASAKGQLAVVQFFHKHMSSLFPDAFKANNFDAFRWASNNHQDILRFYEEHVTPELLARARAAI